MATAHSSEATPLLQSDGEANIPRTSDEEEHPSHPTVVVRPSRTSTEKFLFGCFATSLATGCLSIPFNIASLALGDYGESEYGYYSNRYNSIEEAVAMCIIGLALAGLNIFNMKRIGRVTANAVNVVVYGCAAFAIYAMASMDFNNRLNSACFRDLKGGPYEGDNPHRWRPPGTYQECLQWLVEYKIVTAIYLVLVIPTSLIFATIAVASIVNAYKQRAQTTYSSSGSDARWSIPAGHLSVEVAIRWGQPQRQASREHSDDVERQNGIRETNPSEQSLSR